MKTIQLPSGWLRACRASYACVISWMALLLSGEIHVQAQPTITVSPPSLTVYEDDPATFIATSPGTSLIFEWLKGGLRFGGPSSANFTIARATFLDSGDYVAVVTSILTGLSATSAPPAHLTVLPGVGMLVNVAGSGAVFSTPSRISAPGPSVLISAKFAPGTNVTLTATPAVGWQLGGWSVDGVPQPGAGLILTVTMDVPHVVGVVFSPTNGASYSFIAISGESSSGVPVTGGIVFDSVSGPQISDSGRVLFAGSLISNDPTHPVLNNARLGLWYSRTRISAHLDNAIARQAYSYMWYTRDLYQTSFREMRSVYDFNSTPVTVSSFTSDGDITLSPRMQLSVSDVRPFVLVYEPYAGFTPPLDPAGNPFNYPPPQFQTVANPDQAADVPPQSASQLKLWKGAGAAVFQGDPPSPVPVYSGGSRVAFSGTYVTYDILVTPTSTNSNPVATNSGLFSGTRLGGIGLVLPITSSGPGFRSEGLVLGSGNGALASIATYSGGSDAGHAVVWTSDGGMVASVGSAPPNLPTGYPANSKLNTLLNLHLSKLGAVAFSAELTGTGLLNNSNMVFLRRYGPTQIPVPVVRGGEVIAGAPAPANLFLVAPQDTVTIADNASGDLAIGTHIGSSLQNAIIRHDASGNHLAFMDGTPMPGFGPSKKLYLQRIASTPGFWHPPTINARGQIAFFGIVAESSFLGTGQYASSGIWMLEPDGTLRQLLVNGQILPEFGRVDGIAEPRGNRWFNNNGEVAVQIFQQVQITPTVIYKTAILKIGTGPALFLTQSASASSSSSPSSGAGAFALRWPAAYPDAVVERLDGFNVLSNVWERVTPPVRRVGLELEAEISATNNMEFFRLFLPPPAP